MRDRIELAMAAWGRFAYDRAWRTILFSLCVVAALATQLPKMRLDTSTESFLHENDPIRTTYAEFRREFGRDDLILLAIEPPQVFEFGFLEKLRDLHEAIERDVPNLEEVTSLINARNTRGEDDELIVEDLFEDWPQTEEDLAAIEARARANELYKDQLISANGRFTTVMIQTVAYSTLGDEDAELEFADEGDTNEPAFLTGEENEEIVAAVQAIVERFDGPDFRIYLAGAPTMVVYLQNVIQRDMARFTSLAMVTIAVFLALLFRTVAGVVLPLVIVVLSLVSALAAMAALDVPITLPSQILPSFLLAVGVGACVHVLVIFYQRYSHGHDKRESIALALGHSGLAIIMASLTTAGGLISFITADLAPIAEFGIAAPIGVMLSLVLTIVLLPALIAVFPLRMRREDESTRLELRARRVLVRVGQMSVERAWFVALATAGILAIALLGALQIRFSHHPIDWFPESDPFRIATEILNEEFRGGMSLEIVIDTQRENGVHDPELLRDLDELRRYSASVQVGDVIVGKTVSVADVVKEIHRALNEDRPEFYAIPDDRQLVAQELLLFENSGSEDLEDFVDARFSKARFTMRLPFVDAIQYGPLMDKFDRDFPTILGDDVEITITGLMGLMGRTISAVIYSMARTYAVAFLVITPLMVLLIGNLRVGLLSMIPNLAPILITLGLMGWFGIPLDAFTLLIGCIAIGLAVDDTIHFMHNFRRYYSQSGDVTSAVSQTLETTGVAMLFTSLVLSAGFFIYMLSSMANLFNFGLLTGFTIIVAFLADVILAPALMALATRPGRSPAVGAETMEVPR